MRKILFAVISLTFFALYLRHSAPTVTAGDSGEFMTAAATLSLAHPPSYPLYALSARAFSDLIPWADKSFRFNLFSAVLSGLSVGLLFLFFTEIGLGFLTAGLCVLPLAFSHSFWMNSLVTEVFSLNTFMAMLLLAVLVRAKDQIHILNLGWLILGIGLGNHQILGVMGVVYIWTSFRQWGFEIVRRQLKYWALLFFLGFSVNLYLPIRAADTPPLNWGKPDTVKRLTRTLLRKDYGSLTLSLGDTPARNLPNTIHQLQRFGRQLNHEIPWPLAVVGFLGLLIGIKNKKRWCEGVLAAFLLSGPCFYLLANLPFSGQSDGIMGRFYIFPALFLIVGLGGFPSRFKLGVGLAAAAAALLIFPKNIVAASAHRNTRLVWDYGQSLLRTLPSGAILFLEGGDDAFYSLAYLHEAKKWRPDTAVHDRGGLIFRNIYGPDFRQIPKTEKNLRRIQVEQSFLSQRPVLYSTMDKEVIPGVPMSQSGFLMQAGPNAGPSIDWSHLVLRSVYPLDVTDYRSRALAAFFPYMRGRSLMDQGRIKEGLAFWSRAYFMGPDVDWLTVNLAYEYSHRGYNFLQGGQPEAAELFYRAWIKLDPANYQASANLGVAVERQGRWEEALELNDQTSARFPKESDPAYNNAVILWKTRNWTKIRTYLEEALKRNPQHTGARQALAKIPPH
jgi:tetratricopeptide (TPR) repeat protein